MDGLLVERMRMLSSNTSSQGGGLSRSLEGGGGGYRLVG